MKKLNCTFKVNGKKAHTLKIAIDEKIHMDIVRKVTNGAQKAYVKSNAPNPTIASLNLSRLILGQYVELDTIASKSLHEGSVDADLELVLTESDVFGQTVSCHFLV